MPTHMRLEAPIDRWDEAIPLGNGLTGALLWGRDNHIKLSLDRGDLWDLRESELFSRPKWTWRHLRELVAEHKQEEIINFFERPSRELPYPTKIPAGRIEMTLEDGSRVEAFELDMAQALGRAEFEHGALEVLVSAAAPVGMARFPGSMTITLAPPPYIGEKSPPEGKQRKLADLGYPPTRQGTTGDIQWFSQQTTGPFQYAIAVGTRRQGKQTTVAYAVTTTNDVPAPAPGKPGLTESGSVAPAPGGPVAEACRRVQAALDRGFDAMLKDHVAWWRDFWSVSAIQVPDPAVQQHYELVNYFYGAASRRGAPPIPLQGVWTADEGGIPPWRGDYHNNLNTQLTYWPYLGANHLEEGHCYLDFLWDRLPQFRDYAKRFFDAPGAVVPGVIDFEGKRICGWVQYSNTPVNGVWVSHHFYLHWRYTMDAGFLADRAYPFCREIGVAMEAITEIDPTTSRRIVPLSTAPELHNNNFQAWIKPNSNYDLSLMRWLYGALAQMATALGQTADAAHWSNVLGEFDELAVADTLDWVKTPGPGPLLAGPAEPLTESHRHHSQLMALHPLGTLHIEGSDADRQVIRESLRQISRLGTGFWTGFSFTWMACIAARCGYPDMAEHMLATFLKSSISRNGFHLNGDYKRLGVMWLDYRPFTLEGNFAAAQAVHEMLLQGWGDVLRIFPAIPQIWRDVSFRDLRAEGAWIVSATRKTGRTTYVGITAQRDATLTLRDPFDGAEVKWNRPITRAGQDLTCSMNRGDCLEASI